MFQTSSPVKYSDLYVLDFKMDDMFSHEAQKKKMCSFMTSHIYTQCSSSLF